MAKMLSLEMCHAWNMLALLVPRAGPVFVYVYKQRMMQKSLHTVCCCFHWVVLASPLPSSPSQSVVFPEVVF
jgi:hypothetical protein